MKCAVSALAVFLTVAAVLAVRVWLWMPKQDTVMPSSLFSAGAVLAWLLVVLV